ncbi:sialate O-acetylesterase [Emticicia agri]|uniref:Sialate O-acetylesterase domain-containing protein n=1 Tax=Emticicia agri TaxID=2492393 RepID=A0A4Q5M390_9BACT|nr:sialate O-acetylesterase [Emticicia agri]RYU96317.1 hypothetical protein EWM59_07335 [Emticicia agri]
MKFLLVLRMSLYILCLHVYCHAQVSFTDLPEDLQLFPRDTHNKAIVNFAGVIEPSDYRKISIYVKKDDAFFYHKASPYRTHYSQPFPFQFQVEIYAQPHEYNFRVYVHNPAGDSIEVCRRDRILCGDFYVLYGQSNIIASSGIEELYLNFDDRLFRNFDYDNNDHQLSSLKWFSGGQPYGHVGGIGMHLQKLILQKYGIPTCMINGGKGGLAIPQLNDRIEGNPGAFWTIYGQLYNRVKYANALGKVKGVLWRHGESEACGNWVEADNYPAHFASLYNHLKTDFGGWNNFYFIQLAIHGCNYSEKAGELRGYMRKTKYLFEGLETSTALGIPVVDGFHHSKEGNQQLTSEVFGMIERDTYGAPHNIELHPPDIQKVYYSAAEKTLTLEFEQGQRMHYPADTIVDSRLWQMKDYFFVNCTTNSNSYLVEQGTAQGNKIILKLKSEITGGFLTYLPSYSRLDPPRQEVHLTNGKGLRAMAFYQFPIKNKLITPTIDSVKYVTEGQLKLFFNHSDTTIIERRQSNENGFSVIAEVSGGTYTDNLITDNLEKIHYRIRKVNAVSESDYSLVEDLTLSDCKNTLLRLSGNIHTNATKKSRKIESTQKIRAYTRYVFKDKVELKAGFETTNNATFEVSTSGCNN